MWPPYRMRAEAWRRGHGVWVLLVPRVRRERGADGRRWSELGFYPEMNPEAGDCEIVTRHDETRETGAERASACENVSVVEAARTSVAPGHATGPGVPGAHRFCSRTTTSMQVFPFPLISSATQISSGGAEREGGEQVLREAPDTAIRKPQKRAKLRK